jgi:hypothetical protein
MPAFLQEMGSRILRTLRKYPLLSINKISPNNDAVDGFGDTNLSSGVPSLEYDECDVEEQTMSRGSDSAKLTIPCTVYGGMWAKRWLMAAAEAQSAN